MIDSAIIEFANDAFYLAFNNRDIEQMAAIWSNEYPCVCIHPGWQPLHGRDEILESWQQIFANQPQGKLICHGARTLVQAATYSVVCYEELPGGWLVATNNFVMEDGRARLVHHQASPCAEPAELNETAPIIQ